MNGTLEFRLMCSCGPSRSSWERGRHAAQVLSHIFLDPHSSTCLKSISTLLSLCFKRKRDFSTVYLQCTLRVHHPLKEETLLIFLFLRCDFPERGITFCVLFGSNDNNYHIATQRDTYKRFWTGLSAPCHQNLKERMREHRRVLLFRPSTLVPQVHIIYALFNDL